MQSQDHCSGCSLRTSCGESQGPEVRLLRTSRDDGIFNWSSLRSTWLQVKVGAMECAWVSTWLERLFILQRVVCWPSTVFLLKIRHKIINFKFSRWNSWRLNRKMATGKPRCRIKTKCRMSMSCRTPRPTFLASIVRNTYSICLGTEDWKWY